jgi:hypothetical protein
MQWDKILVAATALSKQKNTPSQQQDSGTWVEASLDFEIEDGDEDLLNPDDDSDLDIGTQPIDDEDDDDMMTLRQRTGSYKVVQDALLDGDDANTY